MMLRVRVWLDFVENVDGVPILFEGGGWERVKDGQVESTLVMGGRDSDRWDTPSDFVDRCLHAALVWNRQQDLFPG